MSGMGLWGGIAGAANALQNYYNTQREFEMKSKMYQQEQDILQKRQEALAYVRGDIADRNAANRSDRAIDRDQAKHDLASGDLKNAFTDTETGNVFAYAKDGSVQMLHGTSDDYQDFLKNSRAAKLANADLQPDKTQSEIDRNVASTGNLQSLTTTRDTKQPKDPFDAQIRQGYSQAIQNQYTEYNKAKDAAQKNGQDISKIPDFDFGQAALTAKDRLGTIYGSDRVNKVLGGMGTQPAPKNATPVVNDGTQTIKPPRTNPTNPTAGSTTQPGAPTIQDITAAMNAAVKAGKDPAAVEAWGKRLLNKYGYSDGNQANAQNGP